MELLAMDDQRRHLFMIEHRDSHPILSVDIDLMMKYESIVFYHSRFFERTFVHALIYLILLSCMRDHFRFDAEFDPLRKEFLIKIVV